MVASRKGGFVGSPRARGLPDLVMLHDDPPRMILAEVKGDGGKLSEAQREFLLVARYVAKCEPDYLGVYAWWPVDQPIIETILKTRRLV